MTEPTTQHLYVLQNEFGCVKIGRSIDPWRRVYALRQTEHCRIELVAAFEGGGEDEEAIHIELDEYRLEGEWFDGTHEARKAIARLFEIAETDWKYDHDPAGAEKWLSHLRVVREAYYIRNLISKRIGDLRRAEGPSWIPDAATFECLHLAETGERIVISVEEEKGQTVIAWYEVIDENRFPIKRVRHLIPAYTSSVELALLAWPEDIRPERWEGTAIECCIAALMAIRQRLPKVPRQAKED